MSTWAQVVLIALALSAVLVGCIRSSPTRDPAKDAQLQIDADARQISFPAVLDLEAFTGGDPPGHHLITWGEGRAGPKALVRTSVSDTAVLDALESLGAKPGDTLTEASWTYRDDPERPEPDARATGPALTVSLVLPNEREVAVEALLNDVDKRGFAWVLAGNRALIPVWKSGCVVCLQSCPGSKIANANATIRHLHEGESRFEPSALAKELGNGAQLTVRVSLVE